jgi:signal transduction histidine kinase
MRFRDQPIARKALTLGVVPAVCALIIVSVAVGSAVYLTVKVTLHNDNQALAAIIADNVLATVRFDRPDEAEEMLRGFRADRDVDKICVYRSDGTLFAFYAEPPHRCAATDERERPGEGQLLSRGLVTLGDKRVGSVLLTANSDALRRQMQTLAASAAAALLVSALIGAILSLRLQRSVAGPITALAETADRVADGQAFHLRARKTTDDEVGRLVLAFNAMLDQIQRQDRMKDEFLATLSHELRTPLNATLGWLQILQKTGPDATRIERALSSIERNARAQQRVVEDLLDISRIVTGRLQMTSEVVDLRTVLAAAIDVVSESALRKPLALRTSAPTVPCLVSGDPGRLQQAFWNLLSNSIKFTPANGTVSATLSPAEQGYELTVTDTGIGIAPEFLPHVFDRFQQADGSTTREHSGLGLGLAIVKEIATLHGGTINATSAGTGKGATFVLWLPALVVETSAMRRPDQGATTIH